MMLLNGSMPMLPGDISAGSAGLSNISSAQCLTGSAPLLCAPAVLSDWLVLLALAIWLGGLFWQAGIIERVAERDSSLIPTALATGAGFYRVAVVALVVFLAANIGYFIGLLMLEGGSWASGFSPMLWWDALRSGSFGVFWLLRGLLALLTLLLLILFPHQSVAGEDWRPRQRLYWAHMALAILLLAALALSEQTLATQAKGAPGALAVPVEWLFLLALALWVGGLLFSAVILFPAIWRYESAERGRILAAVLPHFSSIALVSAVTVALSGIFNTSTQLTSWSQLTGTPYGRALLVGLLLLIAMLGIGAYHAAWLRPALSRQLASWDRLHAAALPATAGAEAEDEMQEVGVALQGLAQTGIAEVVSAADQAADAQEMQSGSDSDTIVASQVEKQDASQDARAQERATESSGTASHALRQMDALHARVHSWIQYEAMLGVVALLCVALLGGLAGSLASASPGSNGPTLTATTKTPVNITHTADHLRVTFKVTPDTFGTNTFGVLVVDASTGQPIDGGSVHLAFIMLDMDMGTVTSDLKDVGKGFYVGKGDLIMNGHWQVQVQVRVPQDPTTIHQFIFDFAVSFS